MERECDNCGKIYDARSADIKRGWGLTCGKKCAAEKREKSKPGYDTNKVANNNMKRELWFNKYRSTELKLRKKHPDWNDTKVWAELYKITNDDMFLTKEIRDIFIF